MKTNFVLKMNDASCSTYIQYIKSKESLANICWWNTVPSNPMGFNGWTTSNIIYYMADPIYYYKEKVFHFDASTIASRIFFGSFRQQYFSEIQKQHIHENENNPIFQSNLTATSIKIKAWIWCSGYKKAKVFPLAIAQNLLLPNSNFMSVDHLPRNSLWSWWTHKCWTTFHLNFTANRTSELMISSSFHVTTGNFRFQFYVLAIAFQALLVLERINVDWNLFWLSNYRVIFGFQNKINEMANIKLK